MTLFYSCGGEVIAATVGNIEALQPNDSFPVWAQITSLFPWFSLAMLSLPLSLVTLRYITLATYFYDLSIAGYRAMG